MRRHTVTLLFAVLVAATVPGAIDATASALADRDVRSVSVAIYAWLKLGVVAAFTVFVAVREPSRRPSRDPIAFAACGAAIAAGVALRGPDGGDATSLVVVGEVVTVAAGVWLLASVLALGRCFGVLPEARGLVTRGPYAIVRHPVYLGEFGAYGGLVIAAPSVRNLVLASVFAAAQVVRIRLEERALLTEFPEYGSYMQRVPRLVPAARVGWTIAVPRRSSS